MSNNTIIASVGWLAVAIHMAVGIVAARQMTRLPLIPLLNLVTAGLVLAYWVERWYSYLFRGITWYVSDQLLPACALLICLISALSLAGRYQGTAVHWVIFGIDSAVVLAAALFLTFFRMTRMI
ncbi:MAG: hypothetical protein ABJC74_08685 [Gemmatimonadota bacterium]